MAIVETLQSGNITIPVIFEQDRRLPLVSMQFVFRDSGSLSDSSAGVAKLSAKLLGEGSKEPGSEKFADMLESRAVSLSASAGAETFVVTLSALSSEFEFALDMLERLLSDPNYSDEAFEKIQMQTIGELTHKQSDFDYVASNGLKSLLFEGTPREHPFGGTIESIKSITLGELRDHISKHLGKENLIVVAGGDMSQDDLSKAVDRVLKVLGDTTPEAISKIYPRSTPKTLTQNAKTEQAYIYFGAPYNLSYNSDEMHLSKIASFVLGSGGFGSRMMEEIRVKRGLAYSAYSSFAINKTGSYLKGHLQTKIESSQEAQDAVQNLISTFVKDGITADELQSAKDFLLGSEPLRNETLNQRLSIAFNEYYNDQELGNSKRVLEKISNTTLDEINSFISKHSEIAELSYFVLTNK